MTQLSRSTERVQAALDGHGLELRVKRFPASTRTARDAAAAIGCQVSQIAKSLVFRGGDSGSAVLIVASGSNRVDTQVAASAVGEPLEMADPAFVREATGYAIGGVPPVGFDRPIPVYVDRDLLAFDTVWAAAGTPDSVFALTPQQLLAVTDGTVIDVH